MINYNNHNITAITYDNHHIKYVYGCGGNLVWEVNPGSPVITYDYVGKLRESNTEHVDLISGLTSVSNLKLEIKVMFDPNLLTGRPNKRHRLFFWEGQYGYAQNIRETCHDYAMLNIYNVSNAGSISSISSNLLGTESTNQFIFTFDNVGKKFNVYNLTKEIYDATDINFSMSDVFSIFDVEGCGKIFYVKIYDGDVLIHNFIPGKTKAENRPVMYDDITGDYVELPNALYFGNM